MASRAGRLVHIAGDEPLGSVGVPHEIPLQTELWIGRLSTSPSNGRPQTVVAKSYVSGTHCRIWQEHGQFHLTDLSSNGTVVNGQAVGKGSSVPLNHGDSIAFVFKQAQKIVYEVNLTQATMVVEDPASPSQDALVAKLREEIADMKVKLESAEQRQRQLNAEAESTATLQRQVQLLQEIRDTNEACIADLTNKLETERRELRGLQRSAQREQEEVASLTKQTDEMRNKVRQYVDQVSQLQAQLTAAQESELSAKSALELSRLEIHRLTEDATHLDSLNTKCESLQAELERKTGEMQSTKAMLDSTSSALQEERRAHAETKRLLEEAQEQSTRLMRQHAEVQTLARTRADQLKGLSAQLQSTTTTNSRSRAVIESLEKERAALLRGIATVQSNERERVSNCQRTIDDMLQTLSRVTASVQFVGDNLAADFTSLEMQDFVDNSCTQNEPISPTSRSRNDEDMAANTQSSMDGSFTPTRHLVPRSAMNSPETGFAQQDQEQAEPSPASAQQSPTSKRAMTFDSSSDEANDTQDSHHQAATSSPTRKPVKRAKTNNSQERGHTQEQTQSKEPTMPPPISSDYDVTQMPTSPRQSKRPTRQWPLDSMESELPNPASTSTSSHPPSRQALSSDKNARASNTTSSSHIPSEWDVPDLSFSTAAPVASISRQAHTFDGTQAGEMEDSQQLRSSASPDDAAALDDLH